MNDAPVKDATEDPLVVVKRRLFRARAKLYGWLFAFFVYAWAVLMAGTYSPRGVESLIFWVWMVAHLVACQRFGDRIRRHKKAAWLLKVDVDVLTNQGKKL